LNASISSHITSLTLALPQELQAQFELGFARRAPHLTQMQRHLSAVMSVQLFKAVLLQILQAEGGERKLLIDELKTVLRRYLEPLLG
ncbi:MAG TPA: TetR/AcrR family transcriptional regulator, partial [Ktedonobacteraceae bacterium]|nr:TetR/AcrR family transcriptional regulator [Ktedonobacteraceae bacterium]